MPPFMRQWGFIQNVPFKRQWLIAHTMSPCMRQWCISYTMSSSLVQWVILYTILPCMIQWHIHTQCPLSFDNELLHAQYLKVSFAWNEIWYQQVLVLFVLVYFVYQSILISYNISYKMLCFIHYNNIVLSYILKDILLNYGIV